MARLQSELALEIKDWLKSVDDADKALDKLFRPRAAPPLPPVPVIPPATGGSTPKTKAEQQLDNVRNGLKAVQAEMKRLGSSATDADLNRFATRLSRLDTVARSLESTNLVSTSRGVAALQGVLTGLDLTAGKVRVGLDRVAAGPAPGAAPAGLETIRQRLVEINAAISQQQNLAATLGRRLTFEEAQQGVARLRALANEARSLQGTAGLNPRIAEFGQLGAAADRAGRAIADVSRQYNQFNRAANLQIGYSSFGEAQAQAQQFGKSLVDVALYSDQARLAGVLYNKQLARQNASVQEGEDVIDRLTKRLLLVPSQIQQPLQVLLRNGFTLEQAYTALEGAAASAVARGRTAEYGVTKFGDAIQSQSSAMLNFIGISGNLVDFYQKMARENDTTRAKLTKQQKAQAAVNLVMAETREEVDALTDVQNSLTGAVSNTGLAFSKARIDIGKSFDDSISAVAKTVQGALNFFIALPDPIQDSVVKLVAFAGGVIIAVRAMTLLNTQARLAFTSLGLLNAAGTGVFNKLAGSIVGVKNSLLAAVAANNALQLSLAGLAGLTIGVTIGLAINSIRLNEKENVGERISRYFLEQIAAGQGRQFVLGVPVDLEILLGVSREQAQRTTRDLQDEMNGVLAGIADRVKRADSAYGPKIAGMTRALETAEREATIAQERIIAAQRKGDKEAERAALLDLERNGRVIRSLAPRIVEEKRLADAKKADVEATLEQEEANAALTQRLADLSRQFGDTKASEFEKQLVSMREAFEDFSAAIDKEAADGKITAAQQAQQQRALALARPVAIQDLITRQSDSNADAALQGQKELEEARIALIRDGRAKREAELALETRTTTAEYAKRIEIARTNAAAAQRAVSEASLSDPDYSRLTDNAAALNGEVERLEKERDQKLLLARQQAARDELDLERDLQRKLVEARAGAAEAQVTVIEAGLRAQEQGYARDLALAGDNAKARQRVEETYGPKLLELRQRVIRERAALEDAAASRQLTADLQAAEEGGSQRLALENAAYTRYASARQAIQKNVETDLTEASLAVQEKLQQAKAAVYDRDLQAYLKTLERQTGAELAAGVKRLQTRRATAVAEGNTTAVALIDKGLEQVTARIAQNGRDFRDRLGEANTTATDLRTQLTSIDQTPLGKARSAAASPFNTILRSARGEVEKLQKAFSKLTPEQQVGALGQDLARRVATLNGIVVDANNRRNTALLQADQAFERERADKSAESALKTAKKLYDASDGALDAQYTAALVADRRYWEKRLANAKSAEDIDKIEQQLAGNEAARAAVREAREARIVARRERARAALARDVEGATTEGGREDARARQIAGDVGRLAAVNNALARGNLSEAQRNKLLDEQTTLRDALARYGNEDRARAERALDGERAILAATLEGARIDEARTRARQELLDFDRTRLANAEAELAAAEQTGATQEKRLELEGRVTELRKSVRGLEDDEVQQTEAVLASRLKLGAAEQAYAEAIAKSDAAVTAGLETRLAQSAQEIADIDRRIDLARERGEGEAAVNALLEERAGAETRAYQIAVDLARRPLVLAERRLAVTESEVALRDALAGLDQDATTQAQRQLDATRERLRLLEQRLALEGDGALTDEERAQVEADRNAALRQELIDRRDLARVPFDDRERENALLASEVALQTQLVGLADDALVSARNSLEATQNEIAVLQDRLALEGDGALLGKEREEAQTKLNALLITEDQQRRAVAAAQREQVTQARLLLDAQVKLVRARAGQDDAVTGAQDNLASINRELAEQQALLQDQSLTKKQRADVDRSILDLQTKQVDAERALSRAQADAERRAFAQLTSEQKLADLREGRDRAPDTARSDLAGINRDLQYERTRLANADALLLSTEDRRAAEEKIRDLKVRQIEASRRIVDADREAVEKAAERTKELEKQLLALSRLSDDPVANATLGLSQARRDLALADQALRLAQTDGQREEALQRQKLATLGVSGAERDLAQAYVEAAQKALETAEARGRAELELRGFANDAVAAKRLELAATARQLQSDEDRLRNADRLRLTDVQREELGTRILQGTASLVTKERELLDAQRERLNLIDAVRRSAQSLSDASDRPTTDPVTLASRTLDTARANLQTARRNLEDARGDYEKVASDDNYKKLQTASDAYTAALGAQRTALQGLTGAYREQIGQMTAVMDAADRLRATLDPEAEVKVDTSGAQESLDELRARTQTMFTKFESSADSFSRAFNSRVDFGSKGASPFPGFDVNAELDKLDALRDARKKLVTDTQSAIARGDKSAAANLAGELTAIQERLAKQRDRLGKADVRVNVDDSDVRRTLNELQRLGVEPLAGEDPKLQAARIEAEAVDEFGKSVASFLKGVGAQKEGETEPAEETPLQKAVRTLDTAVSRESLFTRTITQVFGPNGSLDAAIEKLRKALEPKGDAPSEAKKTPAPTTPLSSPVRVTYSYNGRTFESTAELNAYMNREDDIKAGRLGGPLAPSAADIEGALTRALTAVFRPPTPGSDRLRDMQGRGTYNVTNTVTVEIHQSPGQALDAEDVADIVIERFERQARDHGCIDRP